MLRSTFCVKTMPTNNTGLSADVAMPIVFLVASLFFLVWCVRQFRIFQETRQYAQFVIPVWRPLVWLHGLLVPIWSLVSIMLFVVGDVVAAAACAAFVPAIAGLVLFWMSCDILACPDGIHAGGKLMRWCEIYSFSLRFMSLDVLGKTGCITRKSYVRFIWQVSRSNIEQLQEAQSAAVTGAEPKDGRLSSEAAPCTSPDEVSS